MAEDVLEHRWRHVAPGIIDLKVAIAIDNLQHIDCACWMWIGSTVARRRLDSKLVESESLNDVSMAHIRIEEIEKLQVLVRSVLKVTEIGVALAKKVQDVVRILEMRGEKVSSSFLK